MKTKKNSKMKKRKNKVIDADLLLEELKKEKGEKKTIKERNDIKKLMEQKKNRQNRRI